MSNADYDFLVTILREIPGLDTDYAVSNIGAVSLFVKILEKMIKMLPSNLSQMKEALESGDMNSFAIRAHGMKGSFKQICAAETANLAESLEKAARQGNYAYCAAHFTEYADKAALFYNLVSDAMKTAGITAVTETITNADIRDFTDLLTQAKAAAEDFDAVTAANCLSSLSGYHFDDNTDLLILKASEEAEAFRPRKALPYITEILDNHCGNNLKKI